MAILPSLGEALPVTDSDHACMREVAEVLARHGKLDRFAMQIAHQHFDLLPGEVLIEQSDPEARTLTIAPGPMDPTAIPTTWIFSKDSEDTVNPWLTIYCVCKPAVNGDACIRHGMTNTKPESLIKQEETDARRIRRDKERYRDF